MNIFTVNQVNQVYVAKALKEALSGLTTVGDILVGSTPDKKSIYFQHKGQGGVTRSDLIDVDKIMNVVVTPAADMARKLKVATVTLDNTVNEGAPVAGQDYILRLAFDGYIGISPEDSTYWKYGVVHVTNGLSASDFYKNMALSLAKNMSREAVKLVGIFVKTASGTTEVTHLTKSDDLSGTYTGIVIKEVETDWIRGLKQQKPLKFTATPTGIDIVEGNTVTTVIWGKVEYSEGDTVGNGKLMADYEYFFMGERGDQYRMKGWPDYVPTEYIVDPTQTYDTIGIHYSYIGANESVQKSEKDITLICTPSVTSSIKSAIDDAIAGE